MGGFKAQVKRDLAAVFFNDKEHADKLRVEYNGKRYNIPVIIDNDSNKDRVQTMRDNADGVYITVVTAYLSFYDLKILPRKETKIVIDDTAYVIQRASLDAGNITLDMEVLDE
jgi:hypothetical protein